MPSDNNGYIGRAPGNSAVIIARQEYTPSGVTTDFTFNSTYTVGYIDAYLNGARLIEATDYTATDGNIVSLTSAAQNGDVLELVAYKAFNATNVTDASGNFTVGNDISIGGNITSVDSIDASGIITATSYYGDGSTLDNAGSTVSASNGLERLVFTTVTSGTMSTCTTDSNVTWNQETSTLSVPNVSVSGTMTQEDVNNIDSVGLVTGRLGLRATKGGVEVTAGVSTFNASIDLNAGIDVDGQADLDEVVVAGVSSFSAYPSIDADNEIQVGTAIQLGKAGVITATSFVGSGADLTDVVSGISLQQGGSWISSGTAATTFNFSSGANLTDVSAGISTIIIGLSTTASTPSANTTVILDLGAAQHHQLTLSAGITTLTCVNGTFGDSHSVVVIQPATGIATVGFSTYFLWPAGSSPNMSEGSSKVDMISFVVKQEGAVGTGTELLASSGLDYSY